MKEMSRFLLVSAVAVMAVAISAVPSEAKGKKRAMKPKAPIFVGQLCAGWCSSKTKMCKVMVAGPDMKWSAAKFTPTCTPPACPSAC